MLRVVVFLVALGAQNTSGFGDLSARAAAAREANDASHAIEYYQQALRLNPNWEEGWWFLGSLLYDGDQYNASRIALSHVIELDAEAYPAWALLGLCEFEIGDFPHSLVHIQRSLAATGSIQPQMEGVLRYHEALLLTHGGKFDKALQEYVWFARKGIQNPELLFAVGLAALRSPLFPKDVPAEQRELYNAAGRAAYLSLAGDFRTAQEEMDGLVVRFPSAQFVHYLRGTFLLAAKPDEALNELRREVELNSASGVANAMLAWAMLQRSGPALALPYAQAAIRNEPELPLAQYTLGRCLVEAGKLEAGIHHLQLAENGDPANLDTHVTLATAYSRAGRPQEARRERLRSLELWKERDTVANR